MNVVAEMLAEMGRFEEARRGYWSIWQRFPANLNAGLGANLLLPQVYASKEHLEIFFFSSRRRHTRFHCDWSSDVCSSDLDLFNRRLEAGAASGLETASAGATLASTAAEIPDLERLILAQENRLAFLLGRTPGPIPRGNPLDEDRKSVV